MKYSWTLIAFNFIMFFASAQKIDRFALVHRHNVELNKWDSLSSFTVGNGKFAFTVDITGLQTFPLKYKNGITLGTQSEWGWHSFIDTIGLKREDALKSYFFKGKPEEYMVQWNEAGKHKRAADWFRQNPHRLQLGNLGFRLIKKNGTLASMEDLTNTHQVLDVWKGEIHSSFKVEGEQVIVTTFCDPESDKIYVKVTSNLLQEGRLQLQLQFPYPTGSWSDDGVQYASSEKHISSIVQHGGHAAQIVHQLDTSKYVVSMHWSDSAKMVQQVAHQFIIAPQMKGDTWDFQILFQPNKVSDQKMDWRTAQFKNQFAWKHFWTKGAAIDFAGSKDPRAFELERRVVLSQYLMKVQETGTLPPQETGLTNNSWFGKPHLEMTWWHLAHNGLWNRTEIVENILHWYQSVTDKAVSIAKRQGYAGARWQKMTDPDGAEVPSSVGAFLIWQQPHPIYFAELCYRNNNNLSTLEKYKELVFLSADFMSSFAKWDSTKKAYVLGKGVIAAQERFKPEETYNPTYELVYWKWALQVAQQWRKRLKMPLDPKWQDVIDHLSALPVLDNKYLFAENATASYTDLKLRTDHPSVLAAWGMMPLTNQVDKQIMDSTFNWVWKNWNWEDTWGWDFPMTAMTATRLGKPEKAIDALCMPIKTNTYLMNGHNYQDGRLRLYLPGNGGLLTAIAMMVAGYDGAKISMPGIPKNGKWRVKYEGLKRMP